MAVDMTRFYLNDYLDVNTSVYKYKKKNAIKNIEVPTELYDLYFDDFLDSKNIVKIKNAFKNYNDISESHNELSTLFLKEMNMLETFATPFVNDVADDETGFGAVGKSYCSSVESLWFRFAVLRNKKNKQFNHFNNSTQLYKKWSNRIKEYNLIQSMNEINEKLDKLNS